MSQIEIKLYDFEITNPKSIFVQVLTCAIRTLFWKINVFRSLLDICKLLVEKKVLIKTW